MHFLADIVEILRMLPWKHMQINHIIDGPACDTARFIKCCCWKNSANLCNLACEWKENSVKTSCPANNSRFEFNYWPNNKYSFETQYWDNKQQLSWVFVPWWFCVSLWQICITLVWPSNSLKLTAPFTQSERHLHLMMVCHLVDIHWLFKRWEFSTSKLDQQIVPQYLPICREVGDFK